MAFLQPSISAERAPRLTPRPVAAALQPPNQRLVLRKADDLETPRQREKALLRVVCHDVTSAERTAESVGLSELWRAMRIDDRSPPEALDPVRNQRPSLKNN